jgi:hypothetical protein
MLQECARASLVVVSFHSAYLIYLVSFIVIISLVSIETVPRLNGCCVIISTNDMRKFTAVMTNNELK